MQSTLLEMKNINKAFGATRALTNTNLVVHEGEVHMLLGENGAGKSTLMKILAGTYTADSGEIYWKGQPVKIDQPGAAHELGIGMVYQELELVGLMSVMENVLMGRPSTYGKSFFINWKDNEKRAREVLKLVGLEHIDIRAQLSSFTLGVQQLIEIAKALSRNASLLILDEPTSALTNKEVDTLFSIIRDLKKEGISFIFITHKIEEVFRIGDYVTVLRDGEVIGQTRAITEVDETAVIHDMVGRVITDFYPKVCNVQENTQILKVNGLSLRRAFSDVSFYVKKGEVLGLAGLVGSGCTEIAEAVFGTRKADAGSIEYDGRTIQAMKPDESLREGMGLLTKDRHNSLLLHMPIYRNVTLSNQKDFVTGRFFRLKRKELAAGRQFREELRIATRSVELNAGSLSGGNQQKVVLSKLLCAKCRLFIMDDPTRGVDVGSKVEIYNIINGLTAQGCSVILISSELPELVSMSDRIYVAREGRIIKELPKSECTQDNVMKYIAGGKEG